MRGHMNIFILRQLDYKIQNINTLAHDETVEPMQRATVAIREVWQNLRFRDNHTRECGNGYD